MLGGCAVVLFHGILGGCAVVFATKTDEPDEIAFRLIAPVSNDRAKTTKVNHLPI